jgi:hypothetical protein
MSEIPDHDSVMSGDTITLPNAQLHTSLLGFSTLEVNAPRLLNSSPESFFKFLPLYQLYKSKHGTQSFLDLCDAIPRYGLSLMLDIPDIADSKYTDSDLLITDLTQIYNKSFDALQIQQQLNAVSMNHTTLFDESAIYIYIENFIANYMTKSYLQTLATTKQTAEAFIHGLQPKLFQQMVYKCDHSDIKITINNTKLCITHYKSFLFVQSMNNNNTTNQHNKISSINNNNYNLNTTEGFKAATTTTNDSHTIKLDCKYCHGDHLILTNNGNYNCPKLKKKHGENSKPHEKFNTNERNNKGTTIIMDSGCNTTYINNTNNILDRLVPSQSISPLQEVALADGTIIPIATTGTYIDLPVKVIPNFPNSLLSVSQLVLDKNNPAYVLFDDKICSTIERNSYTDVLVNNLKQISIKNNYTQHSIPLQSNGLYSIHNNQLKLQHNQYKTNTNKNQPTPITNNNLLTIYPHPIPTICPLIANVVATYQTVQFPTLSSMVIWFHEAWMHCGVNKMIDIVTHKLYNGIPDILTATVVRKYFPYQCPQCSIGNLAQRPILPPLSDNSVIKPNYPIGAVWEIDIKGPWTDSTGKIVKSFSGCSYSLTCVDISSGFIKGYLLHNRQHLLRYIKKLITFVKNSDRNIQILRTDNEFLTQEIQNYVIVILKCKLVSHMNITKLET